MLSLFSMSILAKDKICTGFAENMDTKKMTSGVMKANVRDTGNAIYIEFDKVSYSTHKLKPEEPNGKYFPSGITKEGNIIQRIANNHYRFIQTSMRDKIDLTCQ